MTRTARECEKFRSPAFRRKGIYRKPKLREPLFRLTEGGTTKLFT